MTHTNVIKSLQIVELFLLITDNERNETLALRAHNELLERYTPEFEKICKEVCGKNNFDKIRDLDKEVLRISLEELFLRATSFKLPQRKTSRRLQEKYLTGWFGNIAEKVLENIILENNHFEKKHSLFPDFFDHMNDLKTFQQHQEDIEEEDKLQQELEEAKLAKLRVFARAMERLKPRDREILIEYKKLKPGNKNLDNDRIAYLCKRWKTTHDNLLHIKPRAIKKLHRLMLDEQEKENRRTDSTHK